MFGALLILFLLPLFNNLNLRSNRYRPLYLFLTWVFFFNFFILIWVDAKPITQPYILIGQVSTIIYFAYFILLMLPEVLVVDFIFGVLPIMLLTLALYSLDMPSVLHALSTLLSVRGFASKADPKLNRLLIGIVYKSDRSTGIKISFLYIIDLSTMKLLELSMVSSGTRLDGILPAFNAFLNSLKYEIVDIIALKGHSAFRTKGFTKSLLLSKSVGSYTIIQTTPEIKAALNDLRLLLAGTPLVNGSLDTNSVVNLFNGSTH